MPARWITADGSPSAVRRRSIVPRRQPQRVYGLPPVVEISFHKMAERFGRWRRINVHHLVAMTKQLADSRPARLAATACNDNALHDGSFDDKAPSRPLQPI